MTQVEMIPERAVNGDFHVIKLAGMFHVVFRPDADPEWFRIIASFFTYERAYSYCDIERVTVWNDAEHGPDSFTGEEEVAGLRSTPPLHLIPPSAQEEPDGVRELVRNVYDADEHVEPHPIEDFSDQPLEALTPNEVAMEAPKDYHQRLYEEAICKEADRPTCQVCGKPRTPSSAALCRDCYQGKVPATETPELTEKQRAVLDFFLEHANPLQLVNASYKQIATETRVASGSIVYLVETLERKGYIEVVERGANKRSSVFKLRPERVADATP